MCSNSASILSSCTAPGRALSAVIERSHGRHAPVALIVQGYRRDDHDDPHDDGQRPPCAGRVLPSGVPFSDVADGAIVRTTLLGTDWAVARIDGTVVALADACPHAARR